MEPVIYTPQIWHLVNLFDGGPLPKHRPSIVSVIFRALYIVAKRFAEKLSSCWAIRVSVDVLALGRKQRSLKRVEMAERYSFLLQAKLTYPLMVDCAARICGRVS